MPYWPPDIVNEGAWPQVGQEINTDDILTQLGLITEKWKRFFPALDYYQLLHTPNTPATLDEPVGTAGETMVDDLWGEDIPATLTAEWVQPHGDAIESLAHDATDCRRYADPIQVHFSVLREATEYQLKKMGIDQMKDLIITTPILHLDERGVTMRIGDYFWWQGDKYEVEEVQNKGYWKNSSIYLYLLGNCKRMREGS